MEEILQLHRNRELGSGNDKSFANENEKHLLCNV